MAPKKKAEKTEKEVQQEKLAEMLRNHNTPYRRMNKDANGRVLTPEEKFFDFASKCPAFSLTADDLYILAGIDEVTSKELLMQRSIAEADKSVAERTIAETRKYVDDVKALQKEVKHASKERRDEILKRIEKLRADLCIEISEESAEEKGKINTISQLEI